MPVPQKPKELSESTVAVMKATVPALRTHSTDITSTMYRIMTTHHPEVKNLFNVNHLRPGANGEPAKQARSLANAILGYANYCDQLDMLASTVTQMVHKHVSFHILPEHYPIVGESLLAAIKEVLGDAATEEVMTAWKEGYFFLADLLIEAEHNMYKALEQKPGGWSGYRKMLVSDKKTESVDTTSFYLSPLNDEVLIDFLPGQYISLCIPKEDVAGSTHDHVRNYSISNKPGEGTFRISVKREVNPGSIDGVISNHLHDHVQAGAEILIGPPCGVFTLDTESTAPVVFLAGGIGRTPLISMIEHMYDTQPTRQAFFIECTRDRAHHAFDRRVDALAVRHNIEFHVFYSQSTVADSPNQLEHVNTYNCERLSADKLSTIVGDHLAAADFYFCGPKGFMEAVRAMLVKLGVHKDRMNFEDFGPTV